MIIAKKNMQETEDTIFFQENDFYNMIQALANMNMWKFTGNIRDGSIKKGDGVSCFSHTLIW